LFNVGAIDTGGKFAASIIDTDFVSDVIDTSGKLATGVVDTDVAP
jgi:hypothetical protein